MEFCYNKSSGFQRVNSLSTKEMHEPETYINSSPEEILNGCKVFQLSKISCYLDSSVSNHYVNSENYLTDVIELSEPFSIKIANKSVLTSSKVGKFYGANNVTGLICKLNNVYYLPGLPYNVLSVSAITHEGFYVTFDERTVRISNDSETIAFGMIEDNLFRLDFIIKNNTYSCQIKPNLAIWHLRLGHISTSGLNELIKTGFLKTKESILVKHVNCTTCTEGRLSEFPLESKATLTTRPLEFVHTDIYGPISPSKEGFRYFISFLDDYTSFTLTFCMKHKSEAYLKFREYVFLSKAQTTCHIGKLKCDSGSQYKSKRFQTFCSKTGIQIEYPEQPNHDGCAARLNRLIRERVGIMLINSGLGNDLWNEAVECTVYALNRSFTIANKLPASMWQEMTVDLSNLRIFGSKTTFHKTNEKGLNNDSEMFEGYMIGYAINGYRVLSKDGEIGVVHDVIFDENEILLRSRQQSQKTLKFLNSWQHEENQQLDCNSKTKLKQDKGEKHQLSKPRHCDVKPKKKSQKEERVLYKVQAKLFKLNKTWKERGKGYAKLLYNEQKKTVKVFMINNFPVKICANHYIRSDSIMKQKAVKQFFNNGWVWMGESEADDGSRILEILALEFKNSDSAKKWKEKIKEAKLLVPNEPVAEHNMIVSAGNNFDEVATYSSSSSDEDEDSVVINKVLSLSINDSGADSEVIDEAQGLSINDSDVIDKVQNLSIDDKDKDIKKRRMQ